MTLAQAVSMLLLAYHDAVPLTLEAFEECLAALPPDAHIMRGDGIVDVKMTLDAAWRHLWKAGPMYVDSQLVNPVLDAFVQRRGNRYELD